MTFPRRQPYRLRDCGQGIDWITAQYLARPRCKISTPAAAWMGLPTVEAACLHALSENVHSADVVINILARRRDPGPAATIMTPDALR